MVDKERIKELLGNGLSNTHVATAVGCEESYISQLLSDEQFHAEVVSMRMKTLTEANSRDKRLNALEDIVIDKLEAQIEWITKPREMLQALAVINNAKRRGVPAHEAVTINNNIVNLQIPAVALRNFVTTPQGEVVQVEGQTLVTMPAPQLLKQLAEAKRGEGGDVYEKVINHLPSANK